jgi:hypothetical protein
VSPNVPGSCPECFYGADKNLPLFTKIKAIISVDIVSVEFNLNGLPDKSVHISGFRGEDGRTVELNAVSVVDALISYGRLVRMF